VARPRIEGARLGPKRKEGGGEMGRELQQGKEKENRPLGRNGGRGSVLFLLYIYIHFKAILKKLVQKSF